MKVQRHSARVPAWSCMDGCTCAARRPGAEDCGGKYGAHGEEWRYRTEIGVTIEDDGSLVFGGHTKTVLELTVYTNIYVSGRNADCRISVAGLHLHRPYPSERGSVPTQDCDLMSKCWGTPAGGILSVPWEKLVCEQKGVLSDDGDIVDAPFERDAVFWEWMENRHIELLREEHDASKVWEKCTACGGEGWTKIDHEPTEPPPLVHRGAYYSRTKSEPLEAAFAQAWEKEQGERRYGGILKQLMMPDTRWGHPYIETAILSQRDADVASRVVQWLGSNVGSCFLGEVLKTPAGQEFLSRYGWRPR